MKDQLLIEGQFFDLRQQIQIDDLMTILLYNVLSIRAWDKVEGSSVNAVQVSSGNVEEFICVSTLLFCSAHAVSAVNSLQFMELTGNFSKQNISVTT